MIKMEKDSVIEIGLILPESKINVINTLNIKRHGNFGKKATEQTRQKMSESRKGIRNGNYGKKQSELCKKINHDRLFGKKGKESIAYGSKHPKLVLLNKIRAGIPLSNSHKEKQRKSMLRHWKTQKGIEQRKNISIIARKWAAENKSKKIDAAKKGHKSCPKISSSELKFEKILIQHSIKFIPQYEYELGFMDFFVSPNIAIFIDGNYWHNYPMGTEKDKRQTSFLENNGYKVIRIWESELRDVPKLLEKIKEFDTGVVPCQI
jgi:very-short-patch-repair endonuclease